MILADKIIHLRKQRGWSQEELAEKLNVSRQSVSKWESAQSIPDLTRILAMSALFDVSTDYLLKDADSPVETDALSSSIESKPEEGRRVNLEDASEYLRLREGAARMIAIGTLLCILSPIPLLLLASAAEMGLWGITETFAAGIGVVSIFPFVTAGVICFVLTGHRCAPYSFLEHSPFYLASDAFQMAERRRDTLRSSYAKMNLTGTVLCILSPIPLLCGAFTENAMITVGMLSVTMAIVGIGVMLFIFGGVKWAAVQRLLKEGDFRPTDKQESCLKETVSGVYWLAVTALFLAWSFLGSGWEHSWTVWPIGGVVYGAILILMKFFDKKK